MARRAEITRDTNETKIRMTLNLDGSGQAEIYTGIGFFDHMLHGFARHGLFDLQVSVEGDSMRPGLMRPPLSGLRLNPGPGKGGRFRDRDDT